MAAIPVAAYNAKTLPLGQSQYAAANAYGVTGSNAAAKLEKLWLHRTEVAGGSKQLFDKIVKHSSVEALKKRGQDPNGLQWRLIRQYTVNGKVDPRLNSSTSVGELGVGFNEAARSSQHKKGFLDTFLGQIVTIAAEAVAGVVGGPWAGAAVGAALGGIKSHSILGAVIGGVQGYGVGSAAGWAASGALTAPANGAGITALGGGTGIGNAAINIGTHLVSGIGGSSALSLLTGAAGLIAAGSALKPAKPTVVRPQDLNLAAGSASGTTLEQDKAALTAKTQKQAIVTNIDEARNSRRMSLLAVGAHTGAGDPRRLANTQPQARPGAQPLKTVTGRPMLSAVAA